MCMAPNSWAVSIMLDGFQDALICLDVSFPKAVSLPEYILVVLAGLQGATVQRVVPFGSPSDDNCFAAELVGCDVNDDVILPQPMMPTSFISRMVARNGFKLTKSLFKKVPLQKHAGMVTARLRKFA